MTTAILDSIPLIIRTPGSDGAIAVSSSAIPSEEKKHRTEVAISLKRLRRSSHAEKQLVTLRRKKMTATMVVFMSTAFLGLLLAAVKLRQCRQELMKNANGETEGGTGRRLAEGGGDEDECVRFVLATTGRRQRAFH
ncbi:Toxoplasma gondii family B protein [Toxoplasma gondii RUB]|uniref:Toxoplasma gondii family B protein n=10 Tax=Toxoplasma gondii TaxID=5811 RepID=S7UHL3_TOXGG|nr:Toxoplasma gondii family B protein [Toxoplasma gondii GT1]KAF4644005.1 Toxoplasma gondii family B protein [Toxoplasma gondii]KFG27858.1 Toxoplasma gondii family B protein [Toxoplasma gondii p89]KFG29475.1 Toxoplasma gondii family B protein [Toxoplasma gondii GAB2-2007-GAL-DOM2]KFG31690.1 Toxoplasma gondii family B protein [Toxoplasma gondii FOU]KFG56717.1 Toxoplasma gondii family B protein [Toxoplasma gondii RUB]KFG99323.1 Toxoplasma gondii family B protein [Toxoplasma gondii VAND]KFH0076